jgi:hypothetical protein
MRMKNFRTKFTKWYYRKGYTIRYDPCDYADFVGRVVYDCPGWVRPLCEYFFSPSVYYREVINSKGE